MENILAQVLLANKRGVGQFHLFDGDMYQATWESFKTAITIAKSQGLIIYNDRGHKVFDPREN